MPEKAKGEARVKNKLNGEQSRRGEIYLRSKGLHGEAHLAGVLTERAHLGVFRRCETVKEEE